MKVNLSLNINLPVDGCDRISPMEQSTSHNFVWSLFVTDDEEGSMRQALITVVNLIHCKRVVICIYSNWERTRTYVHFKMPTSPSKWWNKLIDNFAEKQHTGWFTLVQAANKTAPALVALASISRLNGQANSRDGCHLSTSTPLPPYLYCSWSVSSSFHGLQFQIVSTAYRVRDTKSAVCLKP